MGYDKFEGLNQITDSYKKAVAKSLLENELGSLSNGYELSHATQGTSAWSFGGQQLDIGGNKDALNLMKDIAKHEKVEWTNSLETALKSNNASLLSYDDKNKLNDALSSDYGKQKINESFVSAVDNYTNHIDKVEAKLQEIKPDLKLSDGEKLMLVDYHNQYPGGISLNSTSESSLIVKMKNEINQNGDISSDSLTDMFRTTKHYKDNKTSQEARIQRTLKSARELDSQNNQTNLESLPKEAILLADSGQIKSDVNYNYKEENMDKIEEKPEKISARLIFLENDIKNQTYGVIDGSYNISHIRGESGINNPYSYYVDFISDEKIVLSDILNIDAKIKLKERFI